MDESLAARIDRIEAVHAIQQLTARYALAIDSRDIDAWVKLFVDDVDCGRHGKGRAALARFITTSVQTFYRSVHFIGGHTIDLIDANSATGTVYCRAEHEDCGQWIVMAIAYFDTYARRDGCWYFVRRDERHWYSADVLDRPGPVDFQKWPAWQDRTPTLPGKFPSWVPFWSGVEADAIARLTPAPVHISAGR